MLRRRLLASSCSSSTSSSSSMDEDVPCSSSSTTITASEGGETNPAREQTRRVPLLPEEYQEEDVEMEEESPSHYNDHHHPSSSSNRHSTSSSSRQPSLRRTALFLLPLLLQLLQPTAACPFDGCICSGNNSEIVKCEPGVWDGDFPYVFPHATTVDISGSKLVIPEGETIHSFLPNVHTLIMRNCSLQSIPKNFLAENNDVTSLKRLDLSGNDIAAVDADAFTGIAGLEYLDLSSNRRLSLPLRVFDRLETLRTLNLSNCGLNEIEQGIFHGVEHLKELRLQKNALSELPRGLLTQQGSLEVLDLSDNKLISTSGFDPLPSLRHLNVAGNGLRDIDGLKHLEQLTRLDASRNRVRSIPMETSASSPLPSSSLPSSLHWLDLSHNDLESLPTAAFDLSDLTHLNLSSNRHLKDVQMSTFVSLASLEYLSLAHCTELSTLDPLAFAPVPPSLLSINLRGVNKLRCDDCKLSSFPDTVELHGHCIDESNQRVDLSTLVGCGWQQMISLVLVLAAVVLGLCVLVLIIVCCFRAGRSDRRRGGKDSRPITPATAKHNSYGYAAHRKLKGKHSSLSPPLLASSSSSSTSPSGRDVGVYEARLGAGPLGGGVIYGAGGYMDWEGPASLAYYGQTVNGGGDRGGERDEGSSSGASSGGRSDYSEIPAYSTQHRYCVPRSTVARAFAVPTYAGPGGPRLPHTPPPSAHPQGMFPVPPGGTLYPPPKYSPPPPPPAAVQLHHQQQQPHLLLQTPLALQQQLQQQTAAASIPPPCAYSPLTRL